MDIKMNGVSLEVNHLTKIYGKGEWQDYDGNIYNIYSITLPTMPDGKHVTVYSKDMEDTVEDRSYDDGKILDFIGIGIEHWKI